MPPMTDEELQNIEPKYREYFRTETDEQRDVRLGWANLYYIKRECQTQKEVHKSKSSAYAKWGLRIGLSVTVLTALVGTSIFASLVKNTSNVYIQIGAGLLSMLAAVLSAINNYMKYSVEAGRHYKTRLRYSALERKINSFEAEFGKDPLDASPRARAQAKHSLKSIYEEFDRIREQAPIVD